MAKCFLWNNIPFNIAKNPFYYSMFEVVVLVGPRYKGTSYYDLRGHLLQGEKVDYTQRLAQLRESWENTRCSVMPDGKERSILNFLVNCPKETMFIKSIDAFAYVKDTQLLCELLDSFIRQIVMDNVANYVVVGRLLMERYPSLYWSRCVAQCIDLMLEGMGKLPWIKEVIDSTRSVTKYIYIYTHETVQRERGVGASHHHTFRHQLHFSLVAPQEYVGVTKDVSF